RGVVDLPQPPFTRRYRPHEPGDVEHREGHDRTPRERVTDPPVEWVRPVLGEPDDVRRGFYPGQLACEAGDPGADEDDGEPRRHPPVEAVREEVERQRTRRDE